MQEIHIPINMIFQEMGQDGKFAGVFQFQFDGPAAEALKSMAAGKTHLLTVGDAHLRIVTHVATNELRGTGISGIYRDGFNTIKETVQKESQPAEHDNNEK